jgi:hypothetical protein
MSKISITGLRKFNAIMVPIFALQALAIWFLATDFKLPIIVNYLTFNRLSQTLVPASKTIYELPLAWLIVAFLLLSMAAHLIISTVWYPWYKKDLTKGMNRARWIEYSLSASTMIVAIAMLVGIYDLGSLIMLFSLVAVMNLCGLIMEVQNQGAKKPKWLAFVVGCIAGIVPWIIIGLSFWASSHYGSGQIPSFVYWIYVSIFIFFNCFALNMFLQYKKWGPWRDYLFGERVYIILSLVAKSALAWQVFAGTLRP